MQLALMNRHEVQLKGQEQSKKNGLAQIPLNTIYCELQLADEREYQKVVVEWRWTERERRERERPVDRGST